MTANQPRETYEPRSIHQLDDSPGYVYEAMAAHLAQRIQAGELRPNTPLPSERYSSFAAPSLLMHSTPKCENR